MKISLVACFAFAVLFQPASGRAEDGKVLAEVKATDAEPLRAIAWYNTSETPVKSRDLAQTFKATADGEVTRLVFPLEGMVSGRPQGNVAGFAFTVTSYDHGLDIPGDRFIKKVSTPQPAKAEVSEDGKNFIINLETPFDVQAGNHYTVVLAWEGADRDNKVSLPQKKGDAENFRWHRTDRGSWVKSPDSLQFTALGK